MSPCEIFLNGCNEIAANFTDFKPTQKGQKLTNYFGDKDATEAFFNVCLSECTYKGRFYKLYEELENGAEADFGRSSFMGDTEAKFAFVKGIKILNG